MLGRAVDQPRVTEARPPASAVPPHDTMIDGSPRRSATKRATEVLPQPGSPTNRRGRTRSSSVSALRRTDMWRSSWSAARDAQGQRSLTARVTSSRAGTWPRNGRVAPTTSLKRLDSSLPSRESASPMRGMTMRPGSGTCDVAAERGEKSWVGSGSSS